MLDCLVANDGVIAGDTAGHTGLLRGVSFRFAWDAELLGDGQSAWSVAPRFALSGDGPYNRLRQEFMPACGPSLQNQLDTTGNHCGQRDAPMTRFLKSEFPAGGPVTAGVR